MISVPQNKVKQKNPGYRLKTKTELYQLLLAVYPISAFETGKYTRFQTTAQNTFLCQSIKFCHLFSCLNLKLYVEKTQPGRDEGVMEDRKTAPALRARFLRSYVPLCCV